MFGQLFDIEGRTRETIQSTLEDIAEELGCSKDDFIIAIKPIDGEFNFRCYIIKATSDFVKSIPPAIVREITLKEILGQDE